MRVRQLRLGICRPEFVDIEGIGKGNDGMMRLATCNEPWNGVASIEEVFRIAARIGFEGVEIAPFTLADHADDISVARRKEIVRAAADAGVKIVGLHWLFVSPKGLHMTTPDTAVRQKSIDYLKSLTNLCGDLGGTIMILGSPKQRSIEPPTTHEEGWKRMRDILAACGNVLAERNVDLCIEALAPSETNFVQTLDEASRMADEVGHPKVGVMLDVKAMSSMPDGIMGTIRKFGKRTRHFHANHPSLKGVGMPLEPGDGEPVDWSAILLALDQTGFDGWVSCEPFVYKPDPTTVAEVAYTTLKAAMPK